MKPLGRAAVSQFSREAAERQCDVCLLQKDMGRPGLTVHGFRSTFKDWTHEKTNFSNEVSEAALAHVIGDKTEAAYRRGDALEKRRRLMEAWAKFCISGAAASGRVVPLRKA